MIAGLLRRRRARAVLAEERLERLTDLLSDILTELQIGRSVMEDIRDAEPEEVQTAMTVEEWRRQNARGWTAEDMTEAAIALSRAGDPRIPLGQAVQVIERWSRS